MAHGEAVLHFFVLICTLRPVTGLTRLWGCVARPPPLAEIGIPLAFATFAVHSVSPLMGDGESSFDFRFSERGGKNAVGDVLGVAPPPFPDEELLVVVVVFDVLVALIDVRDAPRPPFVVPLRNFE